jgi:hypothetical protein
MGCAARNGAGVARLLALQLATSAPGNCGVGASPTARRIWRGKSGAGSSAAELGSGRQGGAALAGAGGRELRRCDGNDRRPRGGAGKELGSGAALGRCRAVTTGSCRAPLGAERR